MNYFNIIKKIETVNEQYLVGLISKEEKETMLKQLNVELMSY